MLAIGAFLAFGMGKTEEEDFEAVEGVGNWEHTIDVSELEPGKYNILVRARDRAGNEAIGGPFNVFVDPESDLPIISISYPTANQRVGNNLYVIGTARDDDAVGKVEVRIDDGRYILAEGTEFWSVLLSIANLDDGPHTITARATDIAGTAGPEITSVFQLDTTKPLSITESHESGVLVSRRTTIQGQVIDENGVASLTLVTPEGRQNVPLKGGKDNPPNFSFDIDPKRLEEGPTVWNLESQDAMGSIGVTPFLFFVDISPPELSLIYPGEDDRVDGRLAFVGTVTDAVGVESLTYELSTGQSGEIAVLPGDPYWSLIEDLGPEAKGAVNATFVVTDTAGNTQTVKQRVELDPEGDKPVVLLAQPGEQEALDTVTIVGHVSDDDGAAAVIYTIDGAEEQRVATDGGFSVAVSGLSAGQHEIKIKAEDKYGRVGDEIRRRFVVGEPMPTIALTQVVIGEESANYRPGFSIPANGRASVIGLVTGSVIPERLDYVVGDSSGRVNVASDGTFSIAMPRGTEGTVIGFSVHFQSLTGRISATRGFAVQLPQVDEGTASVSDVLSPGLYFVPNGSLVADESSAAAVDSAVYLPRGASIYLLAVGGRPSDPQVDSEAEFLDVSTEGDYVVLKSGPAGFADGATVSASIGGSRRKSAPFSIRTDFASPSVTVPFDLAGSWVNSSPSVDVAVEDPTGVASVEHRLVTNLAAADGAEGETSGPSWQRAQAGESGNYTVAPSLPSVDGPYSLEIRAIDTAGNSTIARIPLYVDRSDPSLRIVAPRTDDAVNGTISIIGVPSEPGTTESVTANGENAIELSVGPVIVHTVAVLEGEELPSFTLVDRAGNSSSVSSRFTVDSSTDKPTLEVQVPEQGGVIRQEFRISGVLTDDDDAKAIRYRVNDGEVVEVATDGTFDISVPLANLEDGEHTIDVVGIDIGDVESDSIHRDIIISSAEPVSILDSPSIEEYLRGTIVLQGRSQDDNGIAYVDISTDNGASYQRAVGAEEWTYRLDTTLLDDDTHSILVRAVDNAQTPGFYTTTINIDNTAPILELTEPLDGATVSGVFLIDGRSEDDALQQVRLVAQALGEGIEPLELAAFDRTGPFAYSVDTSTLPLGWYNLRVEASDRAGNTRRIARNLRIELAQSAAAPEIVFPLDGVSASQQLQVTVRSAVPEAPLTLLVNDRPVTVIETNDYGIGTYQFAEGELRAGEVKLMLRTEPEGEETPVESAISVVTFSEFGPWLSIGEPQPLSFIRDRPYLVGTAGYALDLPDGEGGDIQRERNQMIAAHKVQRVEVSLDNGRTFTAARGTDEWRYRIETTEMPDGPVRMVVRAKFADGSEVVHRHTVIVDEREPAVRLLAPAERERFDESIRIVGVTTDENSLEDVSVVLRPGDKASYELPGFIEGLYVDIHGLGATIADVGAGLTFFDDNVRLQAQVGFSPSGRFTGLVMGVKLLANVFSLPMSVLFGPDLDWLSGAIAVGANFSYFTMSDDQIAFTDNGLVLGGMVAQLEFPIFRIESLPVFNTLAFYTEAQLWFISSDVQAGTAFRLSFGARANVF